MSATERPSPPGARIGPAFGRLAAAVAGRGRAGAGTRLARSWGPWMVLAVVLAVALAVGAGVRTQPTLDQRVNAIASDVRCPSCSALNSADSNAATAVAVRAFIRGQLQQGRSPGQIEAALADRYGGDIILRPPAHGVDGLVWLLPAGAGLLAVAGVGWAFVRWRRQTPAVPADEDRAVVEQALRASP